MSGEDKSGMNGFIKAVRELEKLRRHADALGIFTDDRELLECPSCGLLEDVTSEGILITCTNGNEDMKDSGLRFRQIDENGFACPACGATVRVEY